MSRKTMIVRSFFMFWLVGVVVGCAPAGFDRAVAYYSEIHGVTDAAARHTSASPFLRFNSMILNDLDAAIDQANDESLRRQAAEVLRGAYGLGAASTDNELDRLPSVALKELALRGGSDPSSKAIKARFSKASASALERDLAEIAKLSASELRWKLVSIRWGVEPLPDDRARLGRQLLFNFATLPALIAIGDQEAKLPEKIQDKTRKAFGRVVVWRPGKGAGDTPLSRFAPKIVMEWPVKRSYSEKFDRIGAVRLSGSRGKIEVGVDVSKPVLYGYESEASIHGKRYTQLNYVWWHSERPAMEVDDPVAGHIDGATLRITLDGKGLPAIVESSLNCGCGHEVFVSKSLEASAQRAFGGPMRGKRLAVEKALFGKHDLVVVETFEPPVSPIRPTVYLAAGYHEVCRVMFSEPAKEAKTEIVEDHAYRIQDYGALDRLALGDGIASMFGADGLVHMAGRPEGYLFVGTGILSAGQPRKRGTQRIRWDDFLQDDPHLLENGLRIPEGF